MMRGGAGNVVPCSRVRQFGLLPLAENWKLELELEVHTIPMVCDIMKDGPRGRAYVDTSRWMGGSIAASMVLLRC